jgi:hypothetical protein
MPVAAAGERTGPPASPADDPRSVLSTWANENDEWARYVVKQVLSTGRPLGAEDVEAAYQLFRQEKLLDPRELPVESELATAAAPPEVAEPLTLTRISEVTGVNALAPGAVIEPHDGLTILYGENGTGKTGYARILKALADSRTADVILGDIAVDSADPPSARIEYLLGQNATDIEWHGETGVAPLTRISIFDSPAVTFHVDEDLDYVYTPASLALFNHVNAGIRAVQAKVETAAGDLRSQSAGLISRFSRESSIYPVIETLGAATDLEALKARADTTVQGDERLAQQQRAVAALEANTIGNQLTINQRIALVLSRAIAATELVEAFDAKQYEGLIATAASLKADYETFRSELFEAAGLPAEPEETWAAFIASGEQYRQHLAATGDHDESRCLYCRQPLDQTAVALVNKYREFLDDKMAADIEEANTALAQLTDPPRAFADNDLASFLDENAAVDSAPAEIVAARRAASLLQELRSAISEGTTLRDELRNEATDCLTSLRQLHGSVSTTVASLARASSKPN